MAIKSVVQCSKPGTHSCAGIIILGTPQSEPDYADNRRQIGGRIVGNLIQRSHDRLRKRRNQQKPVGRLHNSLHELSPVFAPPIAHLRDEQVPHRLVGSPELAVRLWVPELDCRPHALVLWTDQT